MKAPYLFITTMVVLIVITIVQGLRYEHRLDREHELLQQCGALLDPLT